MATKYKTKIKKLENEAMVEIPLSALRCILKYPKEKKIICEIDLINIKQKESVDALDEVINQARIDYVFGNYTTHISAESLIDGLKS